MGLNRDIAKEQGKPYCDYCGGSTHNRDICPKEYKKLKKEVISERECMRYQILYRPGMDT